MIALPSILRKNGFSYTQVSRGARSCIYEQRVKGKTVAFEVFIIRISPRRKILGKWIQERELFAHNEAFGYSAWTYFNLERAKGKFSQIENKINKNRPFSKSFIHLAYTGQ